ncbi:hypothetical protein [Sporomusa aerivorans]|uniref:hypothetical protein n=1 Tax=Sporomusa aerivorans TaxID=204936 RepID=UPI00352B9E3E
MEIIMVISTCLAYSDIQLELSQLQETFMLAIRSADNSYIQLTVNYTQAKLLAEGLTGFLCQAPVQPLLAKGGALLGNAKLQIELHTIVHSELKREQLTACQNPLS